MAKEWMVEGPKSNMLLWSWGHKNENSKSLNNFDFLVMDMGAVGTVENFGSM